MGEPAVFLPIGFLVQSFRFPCQSGITSRMDELKKAQDWCTLKGKPLSYYVYCNAMERDRIFEHPLELTAIVIDQIHSQLTNFFASLNGPPIRSIGTIELPMGPIDPAELLAEYDQLSHDLRSDDPLTINKEMPSFSSTHYLLFRRRSKRSNSFPTLHQHSLALLSRRLAWTLLLGCRPGRS